MLSRSLSARRGLHEALRRCEPEQLSTVSFNLHRALCTQAAGHGDQQAQPQSRLLFLFGLAAAGLTATAAAGVSFTGVQQHIQAHCEAAPEAAASSSCPSAEVLQQLHNWVQAVGGDVKGLTFACHAEVC